MLNYLLRRALAGALTLFLITFFVYGLMRAMPGSPLVVDMAESDPSKRLSKEDQKRLEKIYGLDKPWYVAYKNWLWGVATGDLGRSFHEKKPVSRVIGQRIGPTLLLSSTSLFLTFILAVPIGLYATARNGKTDERASTLVLFVMYAIPSYVTGLMLLYFFYVHLEGTIWQLKPGMYSESYDQMTAAGKFWDVAKHMFLPTVCLTYGSLAYDSRFVKANMAEVVRQDYVRTARAKGVHPLNILVWHAFRNTLIPFVTLLGMTLPALIGGSVILESIFDWPGMGQLYLEALIFRDYPVMMAETLMFAVLTLAGTLMADILYAVVDPRVTYK